MRAAFLRLLTVGVLSTWCHACLAQELTPRVYWPAPVGTSGLFVGYQYVSGDVVTDPTLPITGVDSRGNITALSFRHNFSFLDRTSNIQFSVPHVRSRTSGLVEGQFRTREVVGFGDSSVQFTVNLRGAPAMDREGFQQLRAKPRTIVGASILLQAPTGDYDKDFVINAGTNRWAAKFGLGVIWPLRPTWLLETDVGVWVFGDNDEFVGRKREQDPIGSVSVHLIKRIRPGFWASLDANYYYGGDTVIDGVERADLQRNSRVGATLVVPFKRRHAVRLAYSTGVATKSGGDFEQLTLNYAVGW